MTRAPDVAPGPYDMMDEPEDDQPHLVKIPGGSIWFVRTSRGYAAVDEKLVGQELARHWPELRVTAGDPPKAMGLQALYAQYGLRGDTLCYTYTGQTRYEHKPGLTGDLWVRVIEGARPRAVRHQHVLEWLEVAFTDRVLDWLATLPLLDRPTCALLLLGPAGIGKTMLAHACARFFGTALADYDDVFKASGFNDALLRSPIVFLDEVTHVDARSGAFRKLTANATHAVQAKGRPTGTLHGCPRLIVASNNPDPLKLNREELTREDEEAIGQRCLVIDCDPRAAIWLAEAGGRTYTAEWVQRADGSPGDLVETIAWLAQERHVEPGPRFLVSGDAADWAARAATRTGLPATILDAIRVYVQDLDSHARGGLPGVPFRWDERYPGEVLIANRDLRDCWRELLGGSERVPSHNQVSAALARLAPGGRERLTLTTGDRGWFYRVSDAHANVGQ